jgi:5-carboxymethyl-2-hydroxymuconate isomerase
VLNYPIRLNNKLVSVAGTVAMGDGRPSEQAVQVTDELTAAIDAELARLREVLVKDLAAFNELMARKKVPGVFVEPVPSDKGP